MNSPTQPAKAIGFSDHFISIGNRAENPRGEELKQQRVAENAIAAMRHSSVEWCNPITRKMSVGTKPARGPLMPMSNRARRPPTRGSIAITAPNVPNGGSGTGMKYGRLAYTPYR